GEVCIANANLPFAFLTPACHTEQGNEPCRETCSTESVGCRAADERFKVAVPNCRIVKWRCAAFTNRSRSLFSPPCRKSLTARQKYGNIVYPLLPCGEVTPSASGTQAFLYDLQLCSSQLRITTPADTIGRGDAQAYFFRLVHKPDHTERNRLT